MRFLYRLTIYSIISLLWLSCKQGAEKKTIEVSSPKKESPAVNTAKPSLDEVVGIQFTEVRRSFDNGLSFHYTGFQLEPEWILSFTSDTTVKIYSPFKKQFIHYPIYYSHGSVFNFARDWFRIKTVSRDSLVFELLEVENKVVLKKKPQVFMTFYSNNYLKNVLKTDYQILRRPTLQDTLYVRERAALANRNPDSAFAARNPAIMVSTSPILSVEKVKTEADPVNNVEAVDSYLLPKYNIKIKKAYRDFGYYFSATIDENGNIRFNRFLQAMDPEFEASKTKVIKGIIDVYLKNLMRVTPGSTLGIPHASVVSIYVSGTTT